MKKSSSLLSGVVLTLFVSAAFADDLSPPPWRGAAGSTWQEWEFFTSQVVVPPDAGVNPYGQPLAYIVVNFQDPDHGWDPGVAPHAGVWSLSGLMIFDVPNTPILNFRKDVWVQVTWQPTAGGTGEPVLGMVDPAGQSHELVLDTTQVLASGWNFSTYSGRIPFNPTFELIGITGDIDVDQVVIDTWCIPEPQTYALLAGLGLLGFGVWRRLRL